MDWNKYLSDRDREVFELSGYGSRGQLTNNVALLVIDATYAFCGDRPEPILESMKRFRNSSGTMAWQAIDRIGALIAAARSGGRPVIYTRGLGTSIDAGRWASKNTRTAEDLEEHHEIVDEIAPNDGDIVLRKAKPSGFFGTPLISVLVERGIDSLVVCGGTTSGCVRATVVDGFSLNYSIAIAHDATFDRIEASHWMSLFDMDMKYADVTTASAVAPLLEGHDDSTGAPATTVASSSGSA
jgi:nicotinamidase-related amidase